MSRPDRLLPLFLLRNTVALLLVSAHALSAGPGAWTAIGPEGASVRVLAVSPASGTVYAGTGDGGVFKSRDGGATWIPARRALTSPLVYRFALVPGQPDVLYSATKDGLWKSVDGARNWSKTSFTSAVADVEVAPSDPHILYLTDLTKVFRSGDSGAHWSVVGGADSPYQAQFLSIDPHDPERVFAGGTSGVLETTDGGNSWKSIHSPRTGRVFVDPFDSETIYAATTRGLEKTTDGGANWSVLQGLPSPFYTFVVDPSSPGTLYASVHYQPQYGVYRSTDGGASWTSLAAFPDVTSLAVDPRDPSHLLCGRDEGGLYLSRDGGAHWDPARRGLTATQGAELLSAPDGTLYARAETHPFSSLAARLWATRDQGKTWEPRAAFVFSSLRRIALDPSSSSTLYFGFSSYPRVEKSEDGGASLQLASSGIITPVNTDVVDLAVSAAAPNTLFAVVADTSPKYVVGTQVYRSDDGGGQWALLSQLDGANPQAVTVDPVQPSVLYLLGAHLYRSADQGKTWKQLGRGVSGLWTQIAIPRQSHTTLYGLVRATQGPRVWKSLDNGATWSAASTGLPSNVEVRQLAIDPHVPNTLYAATAAGVFVTDNGGRRWSELNSGLLDRSVLSIAVDADDPRTLYAGTAGLGGLFVFTRE